MIVLDTNVLSELMRGATASSAVVGWLDRQAPDELAITAVTRAEIYHGIERLPDGHRREQIAAEAEATFALLPAPALSFDEAAARLYGRLMASARRLGHPVGALDAQIAAIAASHRATLATRNVRDFKPLGIELVNPWGT